MSDPKRFDIHGFDAKLLDIPPLLDAISSYKDVPLVVDNWRISMVYEGRHARVFRTDPANAERFPSLALKIFKTSEQAKLTYTILDALLDFGVGIGPRPFYHDEQWLVTEWIHGDILQSPPLPGDDDKWHRVMAVLGVPWSLPFAKYAALIPMRGTGPQAPRDVFHLIDAQLGFLDENDAHYEALARLVERMKDQVTPEWNGPSQITLNHLDPRLHHFVWDGYHMRLVGWQGTDWADKAYAVGQLSAHPQYELLPSSHWVWYRWELSRLNKDQTLKARATTYGNMMQAYWAVRLSLEIASKQQEKEPVSDKLLAQRERYLKRAQNRFA